MQDTLNALFRAPLKDYYRRRIIVWRDEDGEFSKTVQEMTLDNARVLVMRQDHMFELRRQIEKDFADENILLYCPLRFEKPQDNWLLDVFLYSEEFRADYWSLLFQELNIENSRPVREYARTVSAFFASKERRNRLKALREKYGNEKELQTGIFCVLCGLRTFDMSGVVRAVLTAEEENSPLAAIEKHCGENAFWNVMQEEYGYQGAHKTAPLACHILNSAVLLHTDDASLRGLQGSAVHARNAYGFFSTWLREDSVRLLDVCQRAEEYGNIPAKLAALDRQTLMGLGVYPAVDQILLSSLLKGFAEGFFNTDDAETLLRVRADKPWHDVFAPYYAAVQGLTDIQLFYLAHREALRFDSAETAWRSYENDLYMMDQHYRTFCNAYEAALGCGITALEDDLKEAREAIERIRSHF